MNRYIDSVTAAHAWSSEARPVDEPLVANGAVNSATVKSEVIFPILHRGNSTYIRRAADDPIRHARELLDRIVGPTVCEQYKTKGSIADVICTVAKVTIGNRTFSCKAKEDLSQTYRSRNSMFYIMCKNVPHYHRVHCNDADYDEDEYLYGRFVAFTSVCIPAWSDFVEPQYYGKCTLFKGRPVDITGEFQIDILLPLAQRDSTIDKVKLIKFVQLRHVEGMIALGPQLQHWAKDVDFERARLAREVTTNLQKRLKKTTVFYVMPLTK